MRLSRVARSARVLVIVAGVALLADLFLDWFRTSISAVVVTLSSGSSGLHGWGIAAALLVIGLVAWEAGAPESVRKPWASLVLATGVLVSTIALFTTGSATINAGVVSVSANDTLWPAYVGLVLAVLVAAGAVVEAVDAWRPSFHMPHGPARGHA
jgi:hypothetical protein